MKQIRSGPFDKVRAIKMEAQARAGLLACQKCNKRSADVSVQPNGLAQWQRRVWCRDCYDDARATFVGLWRPILLAEIPGGKR